MKLTPESLPHVQALAGDLLAGAVLWRALCNTMADSEGLGRTLEALTAWQVATQHDPRSPGMAAVRRLAETAFDEAVAMVAPHV